MIQNIYNSADEEIVVVILLNGEEQDAAGHFFINEFNKLRIKQDERYSPDATNVFLTKVDVSNPDLSDAIKGYPFKEVLSDLPKIIVLKHGSEILNEPLEEGSVGRITEMINIHSNIEVFKQVGPNQLVSQRNLENTAESHSEAKGNGLNKVETDIYSNEKGGLSSDSHATGEGDLDAKASVHGEGDKQAHSNG